MAPSSQTIATVATGNVSLAYYEIAVRKSFDVVTNSIDDPGKFMTDGNRHWYSFLRPVIPVVDVHVGTADRRLHHADQHVTPANVWNRHVLQPQTWLALRLHDRFHHFLHDTTLGQLEKHEKIFAASNEPVGITCSLFFALTLIGVLVTSL
jgi:hypothetical protein